MIFRCKMNPKKRSHHNSFNTFPFFRADLNSGENFCHTAAVTLTVHPQAVNGVCDHVERQAYHDEANDLVFYKNSSQEVKGNHIFRMQYMKTYAAPPGVEDRGSEQMIQVHQHSRQQNKPVFLPVVFIIPIGNSAYEDEVEEVVCNCLQHNRVRC